MSDDSEIVFSPIYPPSPVPADDNLIPGELPFTAFGQFGEEHMDKRVFEQDVYWVDIKGVPHLLTEMSEEYRANVIRHCVENVDFFYFGALERLMAGLLIDKMLDRLAVNPDVISYQFGVPTIAELEPIEWLESTPLMRTLRTLTPGV